MAPTRSTFRRPLRTSAVGLVGLAAALTTAATTAQAVPAAPVTSAASSTAADGSAARVSFGDMQRIGVTANLWEWSWDSIRTECPRLHTSGYDGVQVAPPQDSVKRTATEAGDPSTGTAILHPWWEVYQPVDYNLTSRMGDEAQFRSMVTACRSAGVKVYVDAVINHATGQGTTSYGGKDYTPYNYPDAGYVSDDFHVKIGACPSKDGGIDDFNSKTEVWNCNLVGLQDLNTGSAKVRGTLADYLNKLIGYGVSGFRVDAAKHISPTDLDAIYAKLDRTKDGKRAFWSLEVGDSPGVISPQAYTKYGDVLGLDGVKQIFGAFKSYNGSDNVGDISGLSVFGSGSGLTASDRTVSFVTNHDTNHDPGNALTYKDGSTYLLATEWLLADGYGSPQVFSSFAFGADSNVGPPSISDDSGLIARANCANGHWTCDHVKPGVVAMVKFHQYVGSAKKRHVYGDQLNVLAFSRGTRGWAGFNNNTADKAISVKTGLARGTYCDAITGGKVNGACVGTKLTVDKNGRVTTILPAKGAVAFTKQQKL